MAADGLQFSSRVTDSTEAKIYGKVVDSILSGVSYATRLLGRGESWDAGYQMKVVHKVSQDTQGQWVAGLETLNSSATATTITTSFNFTAFTQPKVTLMLESFANQGAQAAYSNDKFKYEEAMAETMRNLSVAAYGDGSANKPLGLDAIVDDGTSVGTIGNQSRTTYTQLNGTRTASGGTLTLTKMATLRDAISAAGYDSEEPNLGLTNKTVWALYEQLLAPQVRMEYSKSGVPMVSIRGDAMVSKSELKNGQGFRALSFAGIPIMKDDSATAQTLWLLNEKSFGWYGCNTVPDEYKDKLTRVSLGSRVMEGTGAATVEMMPKDYGWFYQKDQMLPNQAGSVGRFWVIGQVVPKQFRRNGRLTGITGV